MSTPTAFVIAGPARCGKSTLAHKLHQRIDSQWIAIDSLTKALSLSGMNQNVGISLPIEDISFNEWIAAIRVRDEEAVRFLAPVIDNVINAQRHNVIVDNALWAKDIAKLTVPVRAVFCVDTGEDNVDRLRAIRDSGDESANNWHYHRNYDDDKIGRWADFNRARSKLFAYHARLYGFPVFDLAKYSSFDKMQNAAMESLLDGWDGSIRL